MKNIFISILISLFLLISIYTRANAQKQYDIVVYGATSAGITAAVQASRMGKSVVLIEPTNRIGGLTTGGLGQTDIGNKMVIGGISREFYQRIKGYYTDSSNWKWEKRSEYRDGGQTRTEKGEDAMWTFEPSAALDVFRGMLGKENVTLVYNNRLNLKDGVGKKGNKILFLKMETGETYFGKMFIDATYEGDLMAEAGISYTVGRESVSKFNESLNGVQTKMAKYHQLPEGIDPYIEIGNPKSGVLPGVLNYQGKEGSADNKVQAYCFRMCITDKDENRIAFQKPKYYDELEYELLFRTIEKGYKEPFFIMSMMPNRKTDANNYGGFSSDFIGRNYAYPNGDYQQREQIINEHKNYQLGLLWTLANHPRIPKKISDEWQNWGLPKDEYMEYGHWTPQLYIREARRMQSNFIMNQRHCTKELKTATQPIGMGAYGMDSHHTQRYITKEGYVKNEGDVEVGGFDPYPIDYRAIIPKKEECINLFVPVCLSSTHIAFGSIRMEPVFMILAQSAATAASMCIDHNITVQELDYDQLQKRLLADKQILEFSINLQ